MNQRLCNRDAIVVVDIMVIEWKTQNLNEKKLASTMNVVETE
jgi:hypothetical protein